MFKIAGKRIQKGCTVKIVRDSEYVKVDNVTVYDIVTDGCGHFEGRINIDGQSVNVECADNYWVEI